MPNPFPHQITGADWLADRAAGYLADEQGLGKTASALLAASKVGGRLLVVAPAVVTYNWAREAAEWAPRRRVEVARSSKDVSKVIDGLADIVVVPNSLVARSEVLGPLRDADWGVLVLDEAHAFKTPEAARSRAVYGVPARQGTATLVPGIAGAARHVWPLSGTPMPNNPTELWTALRALAPERIEMSPGRPMNWWQFRAAFCELKPSNYGDGWKVVGGRNLDDLKRRLQGFMLRRRKADHLDLPPKRFGQVSLDAEDALAGLEKALAESAPPALLAAIEAKDYGTAFELLSGEQFSRWRRLCGEAKAVPAAELIAGELEAGAMDAVVVFAHHLSVIETLAAALHRFGVVVITGSVPAAKRTERVAAFQKPGGPRVAVCQLDSGGVGITLTRAKDAVLVESSFVPGTNWQASDRVHRIGQTEPVLVRILSLAGSIDDIVQEIVVRKCRTIEDLLA